MMSMQTPSVSLPGPKRDIVRCQGLGSACVLDSNDQTITTSVIYNSFQATNNAFFYLK